MAYHAARRKVALPKAHHADDAKWLEEQLLSLPDKYKFQAMASYTEIYTEAMNDMETQEHRRENKARRAANLRMLSFVKRCKEVQQERAQEQQVKSNNFEW